MKYSSTISIYHKSRNLMKIFFLHNPKAGGMSLRNMLSSLYNVENVSPMFDNSPKDHRDMSIKDGGFDFYAGHFGFDAYKKLSKCHKLVTNFRDPIKRIKSLYRYWREFDLTSLDEESAIPVRLAQDLTFSEFIRHPHPDLRLYIDNFHFRQLLWSGWESCSPNIFARRVVKNRIKSMPWIYICEMPEVSLKLLWTTFSEYRNISMVRENESRGDDFVMHHDDAMFIAVNNYLDYEIYSYAIELQIKRARRVEGSLFLRQSGRTK